jgi:hypothetical protein
MPNRIPVRLCLALAGVLALAGPAAAKVTNVLTVSNFVTSGGNISSLGAVSGSFTAGTTAGDFVANLTVVENALATPYTYNFTGVYSPNHFTAPSQLGFGGNATFSIGTFGAGVSNGVPVSLSDSIFGGAGTVTITNRVLSATPEPFAWATMLLGLTAVGAGLRRRRVLGALA